jgi:hypothetical protein
MTAVQYDASSFGPMHPHARQSFTWPTAMEPNQMSGGHDLPMSHHLGEAHMGSETSSVRSLTNSPPRSAFSPEQREFKRHHDQARRDSKNSLRIRRTNSHPYAPHSPPLTLADTTSAMNMSIYSTAPAPMSLAEPATTLPSQAPYMQPYSPPLTEPTQYTPTFPPQMQHGYTLSTVDYNSPYSAPSSYDRQSSMSGMYSVPPVMPPSTMHEDAHVRVVQSRPKPQCWDHGCNGRQFSTFSNFLRHQREKSGQATKSVCPQCGQSFTVS